MARFQFDLEGVLRQRKNVEQIAMREYATQQQALVHLQDQLKRLDEGVKAVADDMRAHHLTGVLDVNLIAGHRRYVLSMERNALELAKQIAESQAKVQSAQQKLVEAARHRKTIEKLRDKQFERWMADQHKRENADLDEAGMQIAFENLREEGTEARRHAGTE